MKIWRRFALAILIVLALSWSPAEAGHGSWSVGVHVGAPFFFGPWCGCDHYYRPYPVYVAPPPVIVQPAPVIQQVPVVQPVVQQPVLQPVCQTPPPAPAPVVAHAPAVDNAPVEVDRNLQLLGDADERVRAESGLQLGRLKAERAIDPLAATLAGDRSPVVREAAARALGLIGSSKALPALQRAAQTDSDRDVRHSAQFAVDIVLSNRN